MLSTRRSQGFFLYEAAIAIALVTAVTFSAVDLTVKAVFETNWATHRALSDAYMDREAALMRRLSYNDLSNRGYIATSNTASNVPLAFYTNTPPTGWSNSSGLTWSNAADSNFLASSVVRWETPNVDTGTGMTNSYTYDVSLTTVIYSSTLGASNQTYYITREITRTF